MIQASTSQDSGFRPVNAAIVAPAESHHRLTCKTSRPSLDRDRRITRMDRSDVMVLCFAALNAQLVYAAPSPRSCIISDGGRS
jgi:hypothetical protein